MGFKEDLIKLSTESLGSIEERVTKTIETVKEILIKKAKDGKFFAKIEFEELGLNPSEPYEEIIDQMVEEFKVMDFKVEVNHIEEYKSISFEW